MLQWDVFVVDKANVKHIISVWAESRDTACLRAGIVASRIPYFSESTARVVDASISAAW